MASEGAIGRRGSVADGSLALAVAGVVHLLTRRTVIDAQPLAQPSTVGAVTATAGVAAAACLLGVAETVGQRTGIGVWEGMAGHHQRARDRARTQLGEEALAAALDAGRALSIDDALAIALTPVS